MKKITFLCATILCVYMSYGQIEIPVLSPTTKIEQQAGITDIILEYSRPSKRGRQIFGKLVPYGEYWRTGANANTKITFSKEVKINGEKLKAGSYSIFTKPTKDEWEIIFCDEENTWGSFVDEKEKISLRTKVKAITTNRIQETFTIAFNNLTMDKLDLTFMWDNIEVPLGIEVEGSAKTIAKIDKVLNGPDVNDYYVAALFYDRIDNNAKAKEYIDKSVQMDKGNASYYVYGFRANFYKKLGDTKIAKQAAKIAHERAIANNDERYAQYMNELLESL